MAGRVSNALIFLLNNVWLLFLLWNSAETSGLIPVDPSAEIGTVRGATEAIMHSRRGATNGIQNPETLTATTCAPRFRSGHAMTMKLSSAGEIAAIGRF